MVEEYFRAFIANKESWKALDLFELNLRRRRDYLIKTNGHPWASMRRFFADPIIRVLLSAGRRVFETSYDRVLMQCFGEYVNG